MMSPVSTSNNALELMNPFDKNSTPSASMLKQIDYIPLHESSSKSNWFHEKSLAFSAKGMDHLYYITNLIIDSIQSPGLPNSLVTEQLFDEPEKTIASHRSEIISHFWVMILTVAIGLCVTMIVPLLGFVLCCCSRDKDKASSATVSDASHSTAFIDTRYTCSTSFSPSESARRPPEKSYRVEKGCDSCCKSLFNVIHFFLLLFISFFVICAFVTNESVRDGLHKFPKTLNRSLDDVSLYLNNTQHEINTLLITNFGQVEAEIISSLDSAGIIIKNRFARVSQADSLDTLSRIVAKLDTIHNLLKSLAHENVEMMSSLHLLSTGLQRVKQELEMIFSQCSYECVPLQFRLRGHMDKFRTNIQHDHLPEITQLTDNITYLLRSDIVGAVKLGKENLDAISIPIQRAFNGSISRVKQQIREVGQKLIQQAGRLNASLRSPNEKIVTSKHYISQVNSYIDDYEIYRWYACLIASCVLMIIFSCYLFGYFTVICGNQPTVIENRNRGKEPSSTILLKLGVYLFFIFFSLLFLTSIGLGVVGTLSDRLVCFYLQNPTDESSLHLASLIQRKLNIQLPFNSQTNLAHVAARCKRNHSLYSSIELFLYNVKIPLENGNYFTGNLSNYIHVTNRQLIRDNLDTLAEMVDYSPENIQIISPETLNLLEMLRSTSFDNFSLFDDLTNQVASPLDIVTICSHLNEAADAASSDKINFKTNLRNIALILESYNNKVIPKIAHSMSKIKEIVGKIELEAQYDTKGLKTALSESIIRAKNAQRFIQKKGASELKSVTRGFINNISTLIDQYASHIVKEIESNVGKCEPVSRAVDASVLALCKKMTLPFNGYWLSMVAILILFIPTTLSAYILSNLYSKLKADPVKRHTIESNMPVELIDGEDVPLSHVTNKHESSVQSYILDPRHTPLSHYTGHSCHAATAPCADTREHWERSSSPLYNQPPPYHFS